MLYHCLQESPLEACGYLAGTGEIIEEMRKISSLEDDTAVSSPSETFHVSAEIKRRGRRVIGVFRAHARTDRPTQADIDFLTGSDMIQFIIVLSEEGLPTVRAYRIDSSGVSAVNVDIE